MKARCAIDLPTDTDLDAMSEDELRQLFSRVYSATIDGIRVAAIVYAKMKERGIDIPGVGQLMSESLSLVAENALLPEIVFQLAGNPSLLKKVSLLPLTDQKKIANGEPLAVAEKDGDKYTHRMMAVTDMSPAVASQVFVGRSIRTLPQQIAFLKNLHPLNIVPKWGKREEIVPDTTQNALRIRGRFYHPNDLASALESIGYEVNRPKRRNRQKQPA